MLSIFLLIPLSLMLFVVAIWAVRYAVKSNQFEDLDNASQRIILDDRQERRQTMQAHDQSNTATPTESTNDTAETIPQRRTADSTDINSTDINSTDIDSKS